jgi:hypothetical protein
MLSAESWRLALPLNNPHASNVLFSIEVSPTKMVNVMVVETDLHLNAKHPQHDAAAVSKLLLDARNYLDANAKHVTNIRIVSKCNDQI